MASQAKKSAKASATTRVKKPAKASAPKSAKAITTKAAKTGAKVTLCRARCIYETCKITCTEFKGHAGAHSHVGHSWPEMKFTRRAR